MDENGIVKPGLSRGWRVVLVISLALNLAVVGVIAGAAFSGRFGDQAPRNFDIGLGPVARGLTAPERRDIGRALRRDGALRGLDMRSDVTAMIAALRAEPFDPGRFDEIAERQSAQMARLQGRARAAFVDQVTAMSPARRSAFADALEDALSRVPSRGPRTGDERDR